MALLNLISNIAYLYIWAVVLATVLTWLRALDIVNSNNRIVDIVTDFLQRITEPLLAPIRRVLPNFGAVDLSPLVLILLIMFVRDLIFDLAL